ncbi:hypothetical protein BJ138DRAFT_1131402 [Hygrophoropsis aurantiaca]|uniref:Uncharacterized protein n=1 Tax=Hygrophoropsis aurantiaca TaxID=72124 RepID=A0ACB7ZRB4_9AGAM|nr:hypothetical protein BJ138DRAFT_1131402 [Hygrophoropsis aurantiaca]
MPDFYYGYMIPRSLFFGIGANYNPPYTEELHRTHTEEVLTEGSDGVSRDMYPDNCRTSIFVTLLARCGLLNVARCTCVIVNADIHDDWYIVAVAYDQPERIPGEYLKKYPDLPTDTVLASLKELSDLPHDQKPERYEVRDS